MGIKKGTRFSDEHRAKISAALKGVKHTKERIENAPRGESHKKWKGGRRLLRGYIRILSPNHPFSSLDGYVFEHRLVMEAHIGRHLLPNEIVHHINGNHSDNRIENLMLFSKTGEHTRWHRENKKING